MSDVVQNMMAILKKPQTSDPEADKNYSSGMNPDMYQSEVNNYDQEAVSEEYYEELGYDPEEGLPSLEAPRTTDSEKIRQLEDQLLSDSNMTMTEHQSKLKQEDQALSESHISEQPEPKLEVQWEVSVQGDSETKIKPKPQHPSFVLQDQKIVTASQMQRSRVDEITERLYTARLKSPRVKKQTKNFF